MSKFFKKTPELSTDGIDSGVAESAQIEELKSLKAELEQTKTELADAKESLKNYETLAKLDEKASTLGFEGDVSAILKEAEGCYITALESLIEQNKAQVDQNKKTFRKTLSQPLGDSQSKGEEVFDAKTQEEAIDYVESKFPSLNVKEQVEKARSMYSDLFN